MYTPKIDENQIQRLYRLRESLKENGVKVTMTAMVREAIEKYLTDNENFKKQKFSLMKLADIRYNVRDERVVHSHQLDTKCQKHRVVGAIETKAL